MDCLQERHKREMQAMADKHEAEFLELTQSMTKRLLKEKRTIVPTKEDELRRKIQQNPSTLLVAAMNSVFNLWGFGQFL